MSITMKFRNQVTPGDGSMAIDSTVDVIVDALDARSLSLPVGADQQVLLAFTMASLKGYIFDADGALTLETNSISGAGGQTIAMAANTPLVWHDTAGYAKHFTTDVTTCYFTNAGTAPVNLEIRIGKDSTP